MTNERISDDLIYPAKYVDIYGSRMHFIDVGEGDAILFLHGIPMSCYLWRNIIPHLTTLGRCIAPDLIGFGYSAKPDIEYSVFDHIKYIEKFIEVLELKNITLIMHGWGSLIGFHYAMQHEKNCKGIVFYESFLRSLNHDDEVSLPLQEQLIKLHNIENITEIMTDATVFVDKIIPQNVMHQLSDNEMEHYRRPFLEKGAGKPILQYLKELPNGEGKSQIDHLIADYSVQLTKSMLPKLLLYSVPGLITTITTVMWAKNHLPNLEIVDLGEELHLAQESHPNLMGETISVWLQGIEAGMERL